MELEFLQGLERYLFKLCCICITTHSPSYPAVLMSECATSISDEKLTDVILPGQSYLTKLWSRIAATKPIWPSFPSCLLTSGDQPLPITTILGTSLSIWTASNLQISANVLQDRYSWAKSKCSSCWIL